MAWSEKRLSGPDHQPTSVVSLHIRGFEVSADARSSAATLGIPVDHVSITTFSPFDLKVAREKGASLEEARNAAAGAALSNMREVHACHSRMPSRNLFRLCCEVGKRPHCAPTSAFPRTMPARSPWYRYCVGWSRAVRVTLAGACERVREPRCSPGAG